MPQLTWIRSRCDIRPPESATCMSSSPLPSPPASKIWRLIYAAPDSVQASLPDKRCLRKQLSERRWRARGYPLTQGTLAKDLPVPVPRSPDGTEWLYLLDDVTTSANKRVLAITCSATLSILNQMHKVVYIYCTFKIAPSQFEQVWVVRAHILGSDTVESLIYFLPEDRNNISY